MFAGHFAVAFLLKAANRNAHLATLLLASQFLDFMHFFLAALGIEWQQYDPKLLGLPAPVHFHIPYSHSLLGVAVGCIFMILYTKLFTKEKTKILTLCFAVFSHWILDVIVHRDDMQVFPTDKHGFGLGLWNMSIEINLAIELALLSFGIAYSLATWFPYQSILAMICLSIFTALTSTVQVMFLYDKDYPKPALTKLTMENPVVQWYLGVPLLLLLGSWMDKPRVQKVKK
jgi:hypothetical protein